MRADGAREQADEEVAVHGPLVRFVDDDAAVVSQEEVALDLAGGNSYQTITLNVVLERGAFSECDRMCRWCAIVSLIFCVGACIFSIDSQVYMKHVACCFLLTESQVE